MAGRPRTRARRDAERTIAAKRTFDPAARAAALARATEVGDERAAAEIGCQPATLRSWRSRAKAADAPEPVTEPECTGDPDALSARAEAARRDESGALDRTRKLLDEGRASDARAASQVARDRGDQASHLEADARAAREHLVRMAKAETKLADEMVTTYRTIVRLFVLATGLGWSPAHEALADALLNGFANAERDEHGRVQVTFPEPERTKAREAIDGALRRRYAAEQAAEASEASEPPPVVEASDPDDDLEDEQMTATMQAEIEREIAAVLGEPAGQIEDDSTRENCQLSSDPPRGPRSDSAVAVSPSRAEPELPSWEALPQDWKARYAIRRDLGRYEYARALKQEQREREEQPRRRQSRHTGFHHPGLIQGGIHKS